MIPFFKFARSGIARFRPNPSGMLGALSLLCAGTVLAWGPGHHYQGELILDMLPAEIQDFLEPAKQAFVANTSYPDSSFKRFDENPQKPSGGFGEDWREVLQADFETLLQHGVVSPFALHHDRGRVLSFVLLTRAFRDRDPARAALWAGTLTHSVGDESAFNHGPLVSYLTYAFFGPGYAVETGTNGVGVDLIELKRRPDGRAMVEKLKPDFVPRVISDDPETALVHLMMAGVRGNDYMSHREQTLAASYAETAGPDEIARGLRVLAEIGLFGARETADAIVTAWQYAREGKDPALTDDLHRRLEEQEAAFLREKPLDRDSIYTGLLDGIPGESVVGVMLEPTQSMNRTRFGFGSKYILTAVMRDLRERRIPYQPLDIRTVPEAGLPAPARMPVLIVCAGRFDVSKDARRRFLDYAEAGGRFLWIGGQDAGLLGALSKSLVDTAEDDMLPVRRAYGDTPERFEAVVRRLTVRFSHAFAGSLGLEPYRFHNNPNTRAGWHKPLCALSLSESPDAAVSVLATIVRDDASIPVAAALMEGSRARHVFLPEYLLSPYLLSGETRMEDPAHPRLDAVGRKVLAASLALMEPERWPDSFPPDARAEGTRCAD